MTVLAKPRGTSDSEGGRLSNKTSANNSDASVGGAIFSHGHGGCTLFIGGGSKSPPDNDSTRCHVMRLDVALALIAESMSALSG